MPIVPAGFVNRTQLSKEVMKAIRKLGNQAVSVKHSLGEDSTGEPSIFFRIVLTDTASKEENLAEVSGHIATTLFDELRPYENWGLLPYFSFRSQSEQQNRQNDPDWE
jgi:hypothetical protein